MAAAPAARPISMPKGAAVAMTPAAVEALLELELPADVVDVDADPCMLVPVTEVVRVAAEVIVGDKVPVKTVVSLVTVGRSVIPLERVARVVVAESTAEAAVEVTRSRYDGEYVPVPEYPSHPGTVVLGGARPPPGHSYQHTKSLCGKVGIGCVHTAVKILADFASVWDVPDQAGSAICHRL